MMKKTILLCCGFLLAGLSIGHAADCAEIGRRVAESQGGRLTKSDPVVQNGKQMCVVIVLVDGGEGEKPRRVEVAVPAN